jgi:hypothetical protein
MAEEEKERYEKLEEWCKRVRRDIMALEVWAYDRDPGFKDKAGGPPNQEGEELSNRIENLRVQQNNRGLRGDPGDPPGGPYNGA